LGLSILISQLVVTDIIVLLFGLASLAFLLAGEKFLPGRPVALILVAASIAIITMTSLAQYGVKVVGEIPQGLPPLAAPSLKLRDVDGVIPLAFAGVLLLGILKGVLLAAFASILMLLARASRPRIAFLGKIPGSQRYSDMERIRRMSQFRI
jgi:MFS superfamily sulfate permease-like transporter